MFGGLFAVRAKSWGALGLRLAPWGVPLGGIGGWMVYPAFTTEFKQTLGLHNLGIVDAPVEEGK
jgi:hypothetical protein